MVKSRKQPSMQSTDLSSQLSAESRRARESILKSLPPGSASSLRIRNDGKAVLGLNEECATCGVEPPPSLSWYHRGRWLRAHDIVEHARSKEERDRAAKARALKRKSNLKLRLVKGGKR